MACKEDKDKDIITTNMVKKICEQKIPEGRKLKSKEWQKRVYGGKRSG